MATSLPSSIASPKQASRIVLVPNREILQRRIAESLQAVDEGGVRVAPPVFILSLWVEETAVRLRQLRCMEVPRSLDAVGGLAAWALAQPGRSQAGKLELMAARKARAADRLLRQWLVDGESVWLDPGFYRWRQQVSKDLEVRGLFSAEDWMEDLARLLDSESDWPFDLPEAIELAGFVEMTPVERRLFDALGRRRVAVRQAEVAFTRSEARVVALETPEDEWQAAALWARNRLESGARSLCIVVPQSVTASGTSAWRFRHTLGAALHDRHRFHIPVAGRLLELPAIRDAMMLARLALAGANEPLEFPTLSRWLLSPHWAGADREATERARLELRLRERDAFRMTLNEVRRLAQPDTVPALVDAVRRLPTDLPLSGEWIHDVLVHWGWPGPGRSARLAFEAEQLHGLLERIAALALESRDMALRLLESLCAEAAMPVGGGPLSPVQILAPEVAAGGHYDATWVCHLDDTGWPPPIRTNPFLPSAAREAVPRENPQGQLDYYARLTDMLRGTAPEVRLSWSRDGGEGPRGISPLIAGIPVDQLPSPPPREQSSGVIERINDGQGVPFPSDGKVDLPGGANFFRLQAACPMMAYLRWRLAAQFPGMPAPFASPSYRGILMHEAMRLLYAGAEGGGAFPRKRDVGPAVERALERQGARRRLGATGYLAEAGRLNRALEEWLECDGERSGFSVSALEAEHRLSLGRAEIRVRIDRVDSLPDGRFLLIDYKSSQGKRRPVLQWLEPRVQEPQLPLYAVLLDPVGDDAVGGIAVGVVRAFDCGFDGISDEPGDIPKGMTRPGQRMPYPDWSALMAHWRQQAESLRDEILAGWAENRDYEPTIVDYGGLGLILRHDLTTEDSEAAGDGG